MQLAGANARRLVASRLAQFRRIGKASWTLRQVSNSLLAHASGQSNSTHARRTAMELIVLSEACLLGLLVAALVDMVERRAI